MQYASLIILLQSSHSVIKLGKEKYFWYTIIFVDDVRHVLATWKTETDTLGCYTLFGLFANLTTCLIIHRIS